MALDFGRIITFAPSAGMPLEFMESFNTARSIYCLYQLKPEKIFERILKISMVEVSLTYNVTRKDFLKVALWSEVS